MPAAVSYELCTISVWYSRNCVCKLTQVFFKGDGSDSLAESLFKEVEYNTFLSLAGVKAEPTLHELFDLMLKKVSSE